MMSALLVLAVALAPGTRAAVPTSHAPAAGTVQEERPPEEQRKVRGTIRYIGPSDACTTERRAVDASASLAVGECRADAYRLTDRRGRVIELIDLFLVTSDADAASDMHIPFGMIDMMVPEMEDGGRGMVTYAVIPGADGPVNVIRDFAPAR
jgi:hypothetical protein